MCKLNELVVVHDVDAANAVSDDVAVDVEKEKKIKFEKELKKFLSQDEDYSIDEFDFLKDMYKSNYDTKYSDPYSHQKHTKNFCDKKIKHNRLSQKQKEYLISVYTNICLLDTPNKIQFKLPSEKIRQDISDELNEIGGSTKTITTSIVKSWLKNWRNRDGRLSHWKKLKNKKK